ncbi:unnamed protein product [Parnassius apollo]|uniref:(apollo) hypothetical protein n=1 Tax=Parnassius apollo TaxID=110799 RepID=A0A8S3WTQ6_PARAO|nr:unnamed protein product [Parnassius apollo]
MLNLTTVFMLVGLIFVAVQGAPSQENDIAVAAANGDWSAFQKLLSQGFDFGEQFEAIKNLQPQGPGSHVYGEAGYRIHTSSNVNGQKSEQKIGRKVVNNNGNVEVYELD